MYEDRRLKNIQTARDLFLSCGLNVPDGVDYSVGIYQDDKLLATGSLKGDMIQGMAVDPQYQGEDLSARVITALISHAIRENITALHLFTKPDTARMFAQLGFNLVARVRPYAALMEWGSPGIKQYTEKLKEISKKDTTNHKGAIVMNCNPFTKGHLYLIEQAAKQCSNIYVLAVEEDKSVFPFDIRFNLIKQGVAHLPNVTVIEGGRYTVSSLTFPSYFTRETELAQAHCAIDIEIFKEHIAPALGIKKRFIGTEPFSPVTEIYNNTMKQRLPPAGIEVIEIPRVKHKQKEISASQVRRLLAEENFAAIEELVPDTTLDFLKSPLAQPIIEKLKSGLGYLEDVKADK